MSGIQRGRIKAERKQWRKNHPFGFFARPARAADGSTNLSVWDCGIPGKEGTDWAGGLYKLQIKFPEDYPSKAPTCIFTPVIFHPNVYPSGQICLSILTSQWKPGITISQVLTGVQDLLGNPNNDDAAQQGPYAMLKEDPAAYSARVKEEAKKHAPD